MQTTDAGQRAWDELCIIRTISKLAHAQDNRDVEGYAACFTEHVLMEPAAVPNAVAKTVSAREWAEASVARNRFFDTMHHRLFNHVVDINGDEATCIVDVSAIHLRKQGDTVRSWQLGGRFHLRLKRQGEEWLIFERALKVRYQLGDTSLRAEQLESLSSPR